MHKVLLACVLLSSCASIVAAPSSKPSTSPKPTVEQIRKGELRLDGQIAATWGGGRWELNAVSWTSPRGAKTHFDDVKVKAIHLSPDALVHLPGSSAKVDLKYIQLKSNVAVIGENKADGTMQVREVILFEDYGERQEASDESVEIDDESFRLLTQAREAREAGHVTKALQLARQAVETAVGNGDLVTEAAALCEVGVFYSDLKQQQNAIDTFKRVHSLGTRLNNLVTQFVGLRGQANAFEETGQLAQAIPLLEQALALKPKLNTDTQIDALASLADWHIRAKDTKAAVSAWLRLLPFEEKAGMHDEVISTRLWIARYQARTDLDAAKKHLAIARDLMKTVQDEGYRPQLTLRLANALRATGDKQGADEQYEIAAKLNEAVGNPEEAASIRELAQGKKPTK